jgi:hypothetical protein
MCGICVISDSNSVSVADTYHCDAGPDTNPDLTNHFDAGLGADPDFYLMRILMIFSSCGSGS